MTRHTIAVMGAGSWGTAVAIAAARNGHNVRLWGRNQKMMQDMSASRKNEKYLPGVNIHENVSFTSEPEKAIKDAEAVFYVVPAQAFRSCFEQTNVYISSDIPVINCAKGIEQGTHKLISQIVAEIRPETRFAVLSGPSHAEETARNLPTSLTVSSLDEDVAQFVQKLFMSECMRIYSSKDIVGTELGGSLKNIIALGAGILDGMKCGDNAKAALMTRGLSEIARLGKEMGADRNTFMGLSGIGDLIVTCTSMHSRNRRCGIMIGEGTPPDEAVKKVGMVVEGMFTAEAARELAKIYNVEMPITESVCEIIAGRLDAAGALKLLMGRNPKSEEA